MSIAQAGSPIRKSTDIADICSSPWLIAACHVLHRLLMPRHSPCALSSLTSRIILLILKVELCRQFNRIFEIVIVTHLYDVPQLKLKIRSSVLSNKRPLCCLAYHFFITLFSFQGSIFQLLLQPDLKICLTPGLQIQQQLLFLYLVHRTRYDYTSRYTLGVICWWARVGSNHRPYDYQSYALAS